MDIIELTRELGKAIQADPRFVEMQLARQTSDEDQELQDAIGEFNLKRMAISNEAAKPDRNDETMQRLNKELREAYAKIMANEHMARYDAAKTEFDAMFQRVKGILDLCAEGGDPETCDYDAASCSGDCASCGGGCH
ncbi:YlbF family regulator [Acutalibacter sp. 1XD8-36]|uniref:YlbF family regulator n=1 Tax=Acutalibacter sp. 1XD8-36 TaxID=2320852 RepID=UPI001413308E|nr:YlbF family regulator [Acutalibacter sp. 1XD8-36]NBJ88059.1 YlbF family regulator [Acutalibacter sp. 1XD8-36]